MLDDVGSVSELNLSECLSTQAAFALLLHYVRSDTCSLQALDLSGNALHALSNFSDLFVRCGLVWLSLSACGLDAKSDLDAIADFLDSNPPLEYLDISANAFGVSLAKLGPALARNYRLRSLALYGCVNTAAQAEAMCTAVWSSGGGCGLRLIGLGRPETVTAEPGTLISRSLSDVAETAFERYNRFVLVDGTMKLSDAALLKVFFFSTFFFFQLNFCASHSY